jgi:hypothetical protein
MDRAGLIFQRHEDGAFGGLRMLAYGDDSADRHLPAVERRRRDGRGFPDLLAPVAGLRLMDAGILGHFINTVLNGIYKSALMHNPA